MPGAARRASARRARARLGEQAAAAALAARGYAIRGRNVRLRRGELDIVADDRGTVVFVEVKTRRSLSHGVPAEAVVPRKQRALAALAAAYLTRHGLHGRPCRFDVAAVILDRDDRVVTVEILPDAFQAT